jgi:hypothetical protein
MHGGPKGAPVDEIPTADALLTLEEDAEDRALESSEPEAFDDDAEPAVILGLNDVQDDATLAIEPVEGAAAGAVDDDEDLPEEHSRNADAGIDDDSTEDLS